MWSLIQNKLHADSYEHHVCLFVVHNEMEWSGASTLKAVFANDPSAARWFAWPLVTDNTDLVTPCQHTILYLHTELVCQTYKHTNRLQLNRLDPIWHHDYSLKLDLGQPTNDDESCCRSQASGAKGLTEWDESVHCQDQYQNLEDAENIIHFMLILSRKNIYCRIDWNGVLR